MIVLPSLSSRENLDVHAPNHIFDLKVPLYSLALAAYSWFAQTWSKRVQIAETSLLITTLTNYLSS